MSYVVYRKSDSLIMHPANNRYKTEWKSEGAAKAFLTRMVKMGYNRDEYAAVPSVDYKPAMVEKTNMMSGKKYMEDINTPNYCSPSSESYWSM
tara:strand:- start:222 stop:500 length:279 start_codon:yes stop_codon:yes gene_type:complete